MISKLDPSASRHRYNEQRIKRDKAQIKASILSKEIREFYCRLFCHVNLYQQIIDDIPTKERACKTAETASSNVVASNLDEMLSGELKQSLAHREI